MRATYRVDVGFGVEETLDDGYVALLRGLLQSFAEGFGVNVR